MLEETGHIDVMVDGAFLLATVAVDEGLPLSDLQREGAALLADGLHGIVHHRCDHPLLPRPVGAARIVGRTSGTRGGMRMDVVHQDMVQRETRLSGDHRPDRIRDVQGNLHQVIGDDADFLRTVAQHQAMRIQMLVDAVGQGVTGREAGQHDMFVLRRGNVGGVIAHRQPSPVTGED